MKRILLSSAAIVAFAGAAVAEGHTGVSFTGDAELGYNDDFEGGLYWGLGLTVGASAELDNGLTAAISLDIDINEDQDDDGDAVQGAFEGFGISASDYVLSLTSETSGLYFGDTNTAAATYWNSGGMNLDGDSFMDGDDVGDNTGDAVLRGEASFGNVTAGLSYVVDLANDATVNDDLVALSLGATASFGNVDLSMAYQDDDAINGSILGLSASTSFAGADVTLAYAAEDVNDVSSIGVGVSYPAGPVTVSAFYVVQDDVTGTLDDNYGIGVDYENGPIAVGMRFHDGNDEEFAIEGTYDVGNGLSIAAGYIDERSDQAQISYIAGTYDLGSGAELLVGFADVNAGTAGVDSDLDDLGAAGLREGTTVQVSFDF